MKKRRRERIFILSLLILFAALSAGILQSDQAHASSVGIVIYAYDLSGGCTDQRVTCKEEKVVTDTYSHYSRLLSNADLSDKVSLDVRNLRHQYVLDELHSLADPELEAHINLPYPIVIVNGRYEVNMDKSPGSFYSILKNYLDPIDRQRVDKSIQSLRSAEGDGQVGDYIIYFTRDNCPYCVKVEEHLQRHRGERYIQYDLGDEKNITRYRQYLEAYGYGVEDEQPSTMVPAIFINDVYLRGSQRVADYMSTIREDTELKTLVIKDLLPQAD